MAKAQSQTWIWSFDRPAAEMWPLLADTARFNEAAGLPRHTMTEIPQADGSVRYFATAKFGPFTIKWEDMPVNWVTNQWLEHTRIFENGPLQRLTAVLRLVPKGQGCEGHYTVTAAPANLLGRVMLATRFFKAAKRDFTRLAAEANAFASGERDRPYPYEPPRIGDDIKARVATIVKEIEATPNGHGLAQRLADYILRAQEVDLWRIRPLKLARAWDRPSLQVIELCLQAVRSGLLELHWDLLCPRCRVAKAWSGGLDRLPTGAHCGSCNIDYDRDFSKNVEASFHPAPAIRKVESGEYCMWGPMSVPHVKAQILLASGETRVLDGQLTPGPYRLRTLAPGPEVDIEWNSDGFPSLILSDQGVEAGPATEPGKLKLENCTRHAATAVIEDRTWVADALTADRVTALQAFRDLFTDEVLRPGDDVAVGTIALLFTDLKGSTALYQKIGDARAYHLVREHFAFLTKVVRDREGAIIKTIGDAVMAAFSAPAQAIAAALEIQSKVAEFNRANRSDGDEPIVIKLGIHCGPTIAVTLNDRLDYFGSTVNMAARLQGQSEGGDIVVSAEAMADPAVKSAVAALPVEQDKAHLKGFETPMLFFRIRT